MDSQEDHIDEEQLAQETEETEGAVSAPEPNPAVTAANSDKAFLAYPDLLNVQSSSTNLPPSANSTQGNSDRQQMRGPMTQIVGTSPLSRPNVVHDHQGVNVPSPPAIISQAQRPSRAVGPSVSGPSSGAIPKINMNRQRTGGPPDVSVVNPSTNRDIVGSGDNVVTNSARSSVTVEPYYVRNARSPPDERLERIEQEIHSLHSTRGSFERRVCQTIETIPNQMAAIVSSVQRLQTNIEGMVSTVNERMNQLETRLNNLTISTEGGAEASSGRLTMMDPSACLVREELRAFTRNHRRELAAERASYLIAISEALKAVAGVDTESVALNQHEEDEDIRGHHHHSNGPSSSGL